MVEDAQAVVALAGRLERLLKRTAELRAEQWRADTASPAGLEESVRQRMRQVGPGAGVLADAAKRQALPR